MIFRGLRANAPFIDVIIDGVFLDYTSIRKLELHLEENNHDALVIQFAGLSPKVMISMINRPVRLTWKFGSASHEFAGYVLSVNPVSVTKQGLVNGSPFQTADVICLGASSSLRGKKSRVWENVSLPNVVAELANTYRFTFSIPNDYTVVPRLVQASESDWEMLVRLATTLGYCINMHGTHLMIWDRTRYLSRGASYGEVISAKESAGRTSDTPGSLIELDAQYELPSSAVSSGVDTAGQYTGTIGPFNNNTGAGKEEDHLFNDELSMNITSSSTGSAFVRAKNITSRPFTMKVNCLGLTGCLPGGVIRMDTMGTDADGLWCVVSVKQIAVTDRFVSEMVITRESTNLSPTILPPSQVFARVPIPVIRNSRWESSLDLRELYV